MHAMHANGKFGTSVPRLGGGQVCQGQLSFLSFQGRYVSRGGGGPQACQGALSGLSKGLKHGSYRSGPGATMVELW